LEPDTIERSTGGAPARFAAIEEHMFLSKSLNQNMSKLRYLFEKL